MTYFVGDTEFPLYEFLDNSLELNVSRRGKAHLNWKQSSIEELLKKYDQLWTGLRISIAIDIIVGIGLAAMTGYVFFGGPFDLGYAVVTLSCLGGSEAALLITTLIIYVKKTNAGLRLAKARAEKRSIEDIFKKNSIYLGKRLEISLENLNKGRTESEENFIEIVVWDLARRFEEKALFVSEAKIAEIIKTIVKERLEETDVYNSDQKEGILRRFSKRIDDSLDSIEQEKDLGKEEYTFSEA